MENKQTAVEWLIEKILDSGIGICKEWREEAKEKEKEQIINAYNQDLYGGLNHYRKFDNGKHYYEETHGK